MPGAVLEAAGDPVPEPPFAPLPLTVVPGSPASAKVVVSDATVPPSPWAMARTLAAAGASSPSTRTTTCAVRITRCSTTTAAGASPAWVCDCPEPGGVFALPLPPAPARAAGALPVAASDPAPDDPLDEPLAEQPPRVRRSAVLTARARDSGVGGTAMRSSEDGRRGHRNDAARPHPGSARQVTITSRIGRRN